MLDKYEELNLENYTEGDKSRMVFGNPENEVNLKEQVSGMCEHLKNPHLNLYHWAKGELFDVEAVNIALSQKDKFKERINKNEKKKKNT